MKKLFLLLIFCSFLIFPQDEKTDIMNVSLDSLLSLPVRSASKYFQNIMDAPASVTIVTSRDIELYGYKNLSGVLQFLRSFYISNDRNYSYLGARGFSRPTDYNNRILLLINGHRLNESIYGSAMLGNELGLDLSLIDRIEVVRGPGSVLYGTNAMFAVINIITKKARKIDGINAAVEYGSFQHKKATVNFGKEYDNGIALNISGTFTDIKGEDIYFEEFDIDAADRGISINMDKENYYSFYTSADYKDLSFQGYYSDRKKHIPTAPYFSIFNAETYTVDRLGYFEFGYTPKIYENAELLLRAYYDNYLYSGVYPYLEDADTIIFNDESIGNRVGGEIQLTWDVFKNNRVVVGTEYNDSFDATYTYWTPDEILFDGNFPYQNLSFYLNNNYQLLENLTFVTGIRGEKYSGMKLNIIPRLGVVYRLNSTTFKLLYGEAFRAPNVYEVNYSDPYSDFKVSSGLHHEKINTKEFIVENRFGENIFSTISLFQNTVNNLIDTQLDPSDSLYRFVNINDTKASGVEFSVQYNPRRGIRNYFNYTFQASKNIEDGTKLSNSPEHIFNMGVAYNFISKIFLAAELHYETGRKTVYDTMTDPFFLTNLNLIFTPFSDELSFALKINNIFNEQYKIPGGVEHIQYAIPQPGRFFILRLDYNLW